MRKYLCGTPKEKCTGGLSPSSHGLRESTKMHTSLEDALRCYAAFLVSEGYVQIGAKEFRIPEGKPVPFWF